jgi:hypothetical protein
MGTITIKSDKADDLYLLNELARRLNLETEVKTEDDLTGAGEFVNKNDKEKELMEMISYHGRVTIGNILKDDTGDIF